MSETEAVIPASTAKWGGTLADGTMKLIVHIEPYNVGRAMQLLGPEPGVAIAIARLQSESKGAGEV
jgi:hypothetical protein